MNDKSIFVTRPDLPELERYVDYLKKIWDSGWITNNGPMHQELESRLALYLGIPFLSLYSNATLALISALKCLEIEGEVITTPFSFVATTHALYWNGITPVFCDIDAARGNLDASLIESLITSETAAIMPVHVYGNPCDVDQIAKIAKKHNLKVVYDAAHAFNVKLNDVPLVKYGDLSILSFHATKVFNTIEGGAIICKDLETKKKLDYFKNFGFENEVTIVSTGINAKMNELQAAFGLLQLDSIDQYIEQRKNIAEKYLSQLNEFPGIRVIYPEKNVTHNYSYFPIFIDQEVYGRSRDQLYDLLKEHNIFARRYFYPLISNIPTYKDSNSAAREKLPCANKVADEVLCLPIYPSLEEDSIARIIQLIKNSRIV